MEVLFVDINATNINPSSNLIAPLYQAAFPDMDFFGPGYLPKEIVGQGIAKWFSTQKKAYDFIVIGPNTAVYADVDQFDASAEFTMKFAVSRLDKREVLNFFVDVRHDLPVLDAGFKVMSAITLDSFALHERWLNRINELGLYLWGPNHQFHSRLSELPGYSKQERHFIKNKNYISDLVPNFLAERAELIITAVHFIGHNEFAYDALERRPNGVAVPGVEYFQRTRALSELKQKKIKLASKWYFHLYRYANRAGIPVFASNLTLRNYNFLYQSTLAATRFVYTARDASGIPVRKFFEIPASGAVLVADPIKGFDSLGFVAGEHYIRAEPNEIAGVLDRYDGTEEAQRIARNGQRLVMENHSLTARVSQLRAAFAAIKAGTYGGAVWDKGNYVMRTKGEAAP